MRPKMLQRLVFRAQTGPEDQRENKFNVKKMDVKKKSLKNWNMIAHYNATLRCLQYPPL